MATQAEKCPQCGHDTLMTLPGAKRKSCTLCHFIQSTEQDSSAPAPFQGHVIERSKHKRKKSLNLSSHLGSVFFAALRVWRLPIFQSGTQRAGRYPNLGTQLPQSHSVDHPRSARLAIQPGQSAQADQTRKSSDHTSTSQSLPE